MLDIDQKYTALAGVLLKNDMLGIAVSGGVDSITLAHAAHRILPPGSVTVFHSVTPAVQTEGTDRVRAHADRHDWNLVLIDGGEFSDPDYLRNPKNRCYFCKSNLYETISQQTDAPIASGTNLNDLSDFRPGLDAASENGVQHPFVEAGFTKEDVRRLARELELHDVSELPAQPCLASRIETGLRVMPADLRFVEMVERRLAPANLAATIRCRLVSGGIRLELSDHIWCNPELRARLAAEARKICENEGRELLAVSPYVRGSAFLHDT